jgi:SAM-dependent methyltransferase
MAPRVNLFLRILGHVKRIAGALPLVGPAARRVYHLLASSIRPFVGSEAYWLQRYREGGNSGAGSRDKLAEFKAEVLNTFIRQEGIRSVIEFGCGDGEQLLLADYPAYLGLDISPEAVARCRKMFGSDASKSFCLMSDYADEKADLGLSLDVVYHLVEDDVFDKYMSILFEASERFVVIYSSNSDVQDGVHAPHIRHRKFSNWIAMHRPAWTQVKVIPNRYPWVKRTQEGSFADFYIYEKR